MAKTLIIAEAGVNHNGDLSLAKRLVDAAADAGADYIKFQTFKAEKLVNPKAPKADYQQKNLNDNDDSQFEMLKMLELDEDSHEQLVQYAVAKGIRFLSTAFDLDSLEYLASLGMKLAKVPSGEITNLPYLRKVASLFDEIILSTGMATLDEIGKAVDVFIDRGILKENIVILHCNTEYPTPMKDVNLRAMLHIRKEFDVRVGYSDHTLGIEVPIAAVALGAEVIEKHITLDKEMQGPDHKASIDPLELKQMVAAIRNVELAIEGSGFKEPSPSELKNLTVARKSIHLKRDVKKGETLAEEDLIMLRPGDGISPFEFENIVGRRLSRDLNKNQKLTWSDLI